MSILKYKYKAHKFINYAFYIVVFIFGFLLGFTTQKIDINKLISQVLMIDNVSAYTIYEDENVILNEEYIYNEFLNLDNNFDISTYHNIYCYVQISNNKYSILCYAFSDIFFETATFNKIGDGWYYQVVPQSGDYYYFQKISPFSDIYLSHLPSDNPETSGISFMNYGPTSNYPGTAYSFDVPGYEEIFSKYKTLDFISSTLKFNENLFKDNPDFKEVCIDKQDTIAITRTNNPKDLDYMTDYDYIWFPYEITGIKSYNYHNADISGDVSSDLLEKINWSSDHVYEYDNYLPDFYADKSTIDSIFDDEMLGANLEYKGYTNRYSYYGWTSALFNLWFDYRDGNDFNFFPIFEFQDSIKPNNLNETEDDNKICFYIKKEYSVTKVYKDEFNDVYGNVPTQNGDFNFNTSLNKNNISTSGMMSQVNKFISHISGTIIFIKDNVYAFYLSLPLIVRLFLTAALVLLIVKFIIGMVVR